MGLSLAKAQEYDVFWLALREKKQCCPVGWILNAQTIQLNMRT